MSFKLEDIPTSRSKVFYAYLTLFGGCLLTGSLGSVHAFSVFIQPLELALAATRAQVSALYSLALVCLTIAVLLGHHLYARFTSSQLAFTACAVAALGLTLTGFSQSLYTHFLGYSLLFGGANGIGYGFSLYAVSRALPQQRGMAMGAVTAVYALGATLFAKVFEALVNAYGVSTTFFVMAGVMMTIAIVAGWLFSVSNRAISRPKAEKASDEATFTLERTRAWLSLKLWVGYGFGVIAGLMAIGHATGIVEAVGGTGNQIVAGAMLIGMGNAVGGFSAGWLVDRWAARRLLLALSLLSAVALAAIALISGVQSTLFNLILVGFCYGAIIAVYPVATVAYYGTEFGAKVYGRVFTAWGLAGFVGPWLAGIIFDATGGYGVALAFASLAALISAGVSILLPTESEGETL